MSQILQEHPPKLLIINEDLKGLVYQQYHFNLMFTMKPKTAIIPHSNECSSCLLLLTTFGGVKRSNVMISWHLISKFESWGRQFRGLLNCLLSRNRRRNQKKHCTYLGLANLKSTLLPPLLYLHIFIRHIRVYCGDKGPQMLPVSCDTCHKRRGICLDLLPLFLLSNSCHGCIVWFLYCD